MADPVEMQVFQYVQTLPDASRSMVQMAYMSQRKDRTTALLLSLFLGFYGVDRFYLGQAGLGILKLLTCGGFGFWGIIDWFIIMGATDDHNRSVLRQLQVMHRPSLPQPVYQQTYLPPSSYGR